MILKSISKSLSCFKIGFNYKYLIPRFKKWKNCVWSKQNEAFEFAVTPGYSHYVHTQGKKIFKNACKFC